MSARPRPSALTSSGAPRRPVLRATRGTGREIITVWSDGSLRRAARPQSYHARGGTP